MCGSGYTNSPEDTHLRSVPSHPMGHPEQQGAHRAAPGCPMAMGDAETSAAQPISMSPESILGLQPRELAYTR